MMSAPDSAAVASQPQRSPFLVVLLGWLVPGAGHFLLGRRDRAAVIAGAVLIAFVTGLLLRGPMFTVTGGDVLTTLIQYGGLAGDIASGLLYFVAVWSGYAQPDSPGHNADYGSKFLVAAGLLNILALVDAWEIARGEKD